MTTPPQTAAPPPKSPTAPPRPLSPATTSAQHSISPPRLPPPDPYEQAPEDVTPSDEERGIDNDLFGNDTTTNNKMGKIIITGANRFQQVQDVYEFMNKLLKTHHERLFYQEPYMEEIDEESEQTNVMETIST